MQKLVVGTPTVPILGPHFKNYLNFVKSVFQILLTLVQRALERITCNLSFNLGCLV